MRVGSRYAHHIHPSRRYSLRSMPPAHAAGICVFVFSERRDRHGVRCAAGLALVAVVLSGAGGGSRVALEARSSPGVGWAGDTTGWASGDGGSPEGAVRGDSG